MFGTFFVVTFAPDNTTLMDNELVLPEDASKWYLYFGNVPNNEKVVFGIEGDSHYTLHLGMQSKELDIHKTDQISNEQTTLFRMKHFAIARFFVHFQKISQFAMRRCMLSQKINIGKLKKYNCVLIPISDNEDKGQHFFKIKNKGRHIKMRKKIPLNVLNEMFIDPDEVVENDANGFFVYSYKKGVLKSQGIVFKDPKNPSSKTLYFASKPNTNKFHKMTSAGILSALLKVEFENKSVVVKSMAKDLGQRYPSLIHNLQPKAISKKAA